MGKERLVKLICDEVSVFVETTKENYEIEDEIAYFTGAGEFLMMDIVNEIGHEVSSLNVDPKYVDTTFDFSEEAVLRIDLDSKVVMINGQVFTVDAAKEAVEIIVEDYKNGDLCMGELLAHVKLMGFTIEEVVGIYADCIKQADDDILVKLTAEMRDCSEELTVLSRTDAVITL